MAKIEKGHGNGITGYTICTGSYGVVGYFSCKLILTRPLQI